MICRASERLRELLSTLLLYSTLGDVLTAPVTDVWLTAACSQNGNWSKPKLPQNNHSFQISGFISCTAFLFSDSTEWMLYHFDLITKWYVFLYMYVRACVCRGRREETMRTEIRGYLFSIRMFQVRQASDEGNRYRQEKKKKEKGGRGSVAVSLLHITVSMLKASLFSKESQNVSSVKRDAHTRTARGNQLCTGQIHFEASVQATWALILILYFVEESLLSTECWENKISITAIIMSATSGPIAKCNLFQRWKVRVLSLWLTLLHDLCIYSTYSICSWSETCKFLQSTCCSYSSYVPASIHLQRVP